jgi:hypothetical protein
MAVLLNGFVISTYIELMRRRGVGIQECCLVHGFVGGGALGWGLVQ